MAYVYRHIRLDKNEPFYIGIGSDPKYWRATKKSQRNILWKRVVAKTDYEVEIVMDDLTWDEACKKEIEFISLYGRKNICTGTLVNLTDGGEGSLGYKPTKETKEKLSKSLQGKPINLTKDERIKRSERFKQLNQDKDFIKKKVKAIRDSEKLKEYYKSRIGKKGYSHTEESKHKIRLSRLGKKMPKEVLEKRSFKVVQTTMDGEVIKIWDSSRQIQRETKFSQGNIWRCCVGQYKQVYGYKWIYLKNYKSNQN
jgi:NUMOD3 motif